MRLTEADRERTAIIALTSGLFGRESGLRPRLLTRLP